jgi:hypothetical protein
LDSIRQGGYYGTGWHFTGGGDVPEFSGTSRDQAAGCWEAARKAQAAADKAKTAEIGES